jgi:PTS system nitrogen regulatory IIA component
MKILDVMQKSTIIPDLKSKDKKSLIEELAAPVAVAAGVEHKELVRVLIEREQLGSTGIGDGIGIPHGKMKNLSSLALGFGLSRQGIDFESMDGRPTHIFFLLVTPEDSTDIHLRLLARISKMLRNDLFKERLLKAWDADEMYRIIQEEDESL